MLNEETRTLRTHPSLFPLRTALILAERESPARPHRMDSDEQLAMQLIARMQARYRKINPFVNQGERSRRLAGKYAG